MMLVLGLALAAQAAVVDMSASVEVGPVEHLSEELAEAEGCFVTVRFADDVVLQAEAGKSDLCSASAGQKAEAAARKATYTLKTPLQGTDEAVFGLRIAKIDEKWSLDVDPTVRFSLPAGWSLPKPANDGSTVCRVLVEVKPKQKRDATAIVDDCDKRVASSLTSLMRQVRWTTYSSFTVTYPVQFRWVSVPRANGKLKWQWLPDTGETYVRTRAFPEFPREANVAEAVCRLNVHFDERGAFTNAEPTDCSEPFLGAFMKVSSGWTAYPVVNDGVPVASTLRVKLSFFKGR